MKRLVNTVSALAVVITAVGIATLAAQAPAAAPAAPGAPAAQAPGRQGGGRAGGGGGGRGGAPLRAPSALRAIPAETTAAKVKDPNWKAPRTAWGHPELEGVWTSDDMRGVPAQRPKDQMDRESLTPEEFARRAGTDETSRDRAVNQETILRNEFGVRTFGYTSVVVEPANGQIPAITPAAAARRKAQAGIGTFGTVKLEDFDDFTLYDRCITRGVGAVAPAIYGNAIRIAQTPTELTITYEMIHDTRVIPLDPVSRNGSAPFLERPRLGPNIKLWMGDARGRWEGDTLVIESTNFTDRTSLQGLHSDKLKVTERITRIDPQMLDWRVTVEDPETWVAPFTLRYTITQQPDYDIYEYGCHEGNTAVSQGLSTERTFQREEEELRAKGLPIPPRPNRNMEVYGAPDRSLTVRDVNSSK
jgi:hypothetical protein